MFKEFGKLLHERGVSDAIIDRVRDSGFFLKHWMTMNPAKPNITVSDSMYGNKGLSSSFEIDAFLRYLQGEQSFPRLPPLNRVSVRNRAEILEYLSNHRLRRYDTEGSLTIRGQPREHKFKRAIPNPLRGDANGAEVSILPGLYRQSAGDTYSFDAPVVESRSLTPLSFRLEPADVERANEGLAFDFMRVEQHYARQTPGLDITFDIDSALFFATNRFKFGDGGLAYHEPVPRGEHEGVIYLFKFVSPSVKRTEYLIRDFDFFRTHQPLRILRQHCGLPLFNRYERNIAVTDVDTVLELDPDYSDISVKTPEYMFPNAGEDTFYHEILKLKDRFPDELRDVVEYRWARAA